MRSHRAFGLPFQHLGGSVDGLLRSSDGDGTVLAAKLKPPKIKSPTFRGRLIARRTADERRHPVADRRQAGPVRRRPRQGQGAYLRQRREDRDGETRQEGAVNFDSAALSDGHHEFTAKVKVGKLASALSKHIAADVDTAPPAKPTMDLAAVSDTGTSSTTTSPGTRRRRLRGSRKPVRPSRSKTGRRFSARRSPTAPARGPIRPASSGRALMP